MHLQRSQKTFLVKIYVILLERSALCYRLYSLYIPVLFRTGGSTTETPWFAVPEPFMALDRYKCSHIELISALYGRDCVFLNPWCML